MKRIVTAAILIPTVLYVIFLGPPWLFAAVVASMAFACFSEFAGIAQTQGVRVPHWLGQAMGLAMLFLPRLDWQWIVAMTMLAMIAGLWVDSLADSLPRAAALMLGLLYIYGSWRCAFVLREHSAWWMFFATGLNWVGDTAALYGGKAFGKHKLAPVISPKKTWEGAISSAVFSTLFGMALIRYAQPGMALYHAALLSLVSCVAGQVGDLAESALKRGAGVKDSGNLLPGHGGWLDRLDSTLFSMPVVAFYLTWLDQ